MVAEGGWVGLMLAAGRGGEVTEGGWVVFAVVAGRGG